jgi:uncharacterized protein YbbC (DUF1343 family)
MRMNIFRTDIMQEQMLNRQDPKTHSKKIFYSLSLLLFFVPSYLRGKVFHAIRNISYIILPSVFVSWSCTVSSAGTPEERVLSGLEVLRQSNYEVLQGKRVGLITNATGVDADLRSIVDIFHEAPEVNLVALFGPEHGVRGDHSAGAYIQSYTDERTGLPVYSLYGRTRKPTPEMLEGVDVLVYDIQDIGSRSYTYISTMGLAMEAAAENGVDFVVLDRPNPLGGLKIEGNLVEEGYFSFVSQFRIPYIYGLTSGELAQMLNEEGMLTEGVKCDLTVVPMKHWRREMTFPETGLLWIPTSPHIPHSDSPIYYVATGILGELYRINIGVGYTTPFQTYAAEWIDSYEIAQRLNAFELPGVIFRPVTYRPFYGSDEGKTVHGVQIHITDYKVLNLMSMQFLFLQVHNELYPDKNPFDMAPDRILMFDRVTGSPKVREMFTEQFRYEDIEEFLHKDAEAFREVAKKYYLY